MRILLVSIITAFIFCISNASEITTISGKDSAYAGMEIVFNRLSDPFSNAETLVGSGKFSSDGSFTISFALDQITQVFAYLGVYKVHLLLFRGKPMILFYHPGRIKKPVIF
jgi:hypothetical protein